MVLKDVFIAPVKAILSRILLHKKLWVLFWMLLSVGFFCKKGMSQQPTAIIVEQIVAEVEQVVAAEGIKGVTMALVMPGQDPVVRSFGFSDAENLIPVEPATLFPVASLTKTLTNIALLQLYEQGLIELSDPVQAYLPEFSIHSRFDPSAPITIHHLQCHTSGLPRDMFKGLISSSPQPRPDLLGYLRQQYVSFTPGTKYSYSNLGYELLGMVIERVSGMSYQQYITQNILEPLGMKNSYFLSASLDAGKISRPYVLNDHKARVEPPIRLAASAGLYSCAEDFSLLLKFLLNPREHRHIVGDSLVTRMFTCQKPQDAIDVSLHWGLSWLLVDQPDPFKGYFAYQLGNTLHYNSLIALAPDYGLGLVFFSNTAGTIQPVLNVARRVITSSIEQLTGIRPLPPEPGHQPPVIDPDPTMVNMIRGDYLSEHMFLQIFAIRNNVVLKVGEEAFQLFANEDGWFRLNPELRFRVQHMGEAKILMMDHDGVVSPEAIEVNHEIALPDDIANRLGTYYLANVDPDEEEVYYQELELHLDQNDIIQVSLYPGNFHKELHGQEANTFNLMPAAEGNMIFAGFGMYCGETLFLDQDEDGYIVSFSGLEFYQPFSTVE